MPWSDKLARFKHFLRQVWHLSAPYFSTSAEKWKARGPDTLRAIALAHSICGHRK